jgi:hypothetical protein
MLAVKYMQKEALKKGNIEVTRTYKGKGSSGWTGIDNNVINNKLMTIQARFILIYLLSKNESKDYIDQEIIAENCNLSTKQVSRYLVELKQFKHLEIVKSDKPNKKGHYDYKYRLIEGSSVLPVDINHRTYTSSGKNTNKTSVKPSNNNALEVIKPQDTIGHEPQDIDVRFLYNTINNNTNNTKEVNAENNVQEPKQISDLSEKQKLYITYKNLRKNDPEYLELLKTVCNNTSEEVLKDWLDARPFLETQGNIPYYLLNSIQNQRPLPQAYLSKKSEKIKTELFDRWSKPYEKIVGRKINFSMTEKNIAEMVSNIIQLFDFVRNYFTSKDIEFKCNEDNIEQVRINQKELKKVCDVLKVSELQDLVRLVLKTSTIKNRCRFLLDITNVESVISNIIMISDYSNREV